MSDPFGALATQAISDIGVHIGNGQWAGSGHMPANIPINITGPQGSIATDAGFGWQSSQGHRLSIHDGSAAHPVTDHNSTVFITRESKITSGIDWGALNMNVIADAGTAVQATGLNVEVESFATNQDVAGILANVVTHGTSHVAFGAYLQAGTKTSGSGAVTLNTALDNSSGNNHIFHASGAGNDMVGIAIQTISDVVHTSGSGIVFINNGPVWDTGIGFMSNTIANWYWTCDAFTVGTETASTHVFTGYAPVTINGTNGATLDFQAGLVSKDRITGDVNALYLTALGTISFNAGSISGTGTERMTVETFAGAANQTAVHIYEGATPTKRQLRTFDPGAAGINFTAGQLVCVLV